MTAVTKKGKDESDEQDQELENKIRSITRFLEEIDRWRNAKGKELWRRVTKERVEIIQELYDTAVEATLDETVTANGLKQKLDGPWFIWAGADFTHMAREHSNSKDAGSDDDDSSEGSESEDEDSGQEESKKRQLEALEIRNSKPKKKQKLRHPAEIEGNEEREQVLICEQ